MIILPLAKEDLKEAKVWYENKLKGLGKRFLSEVDKKINFIKINPLASNIRYDEIPMMQTSQTNMIKSLGFHVAFETKINLNT